MEYHILHADSKRFCRPPHPGRRRDPHVVRDGLRAARRRQRPTDCPRTWFGSTPTRTRPGPPAVSLDAMREALPVSGRYHYNEFGQIHKAIAGSEELTPNQIVTGAGSSEVLHTAVDVFTSPTRPLISVTPAYEGPIELARALGRPVVLTKLRDDYTADVKLLAEAADKAGGGLIYLCNPNNPTSAVVKSERGRLAGGQPSRQYDAPGGRGLHPFRGIAGRQERDPLRAPGQGRDRRAHVLQDLRHGRSARRLRRGQTFDHRQARAAADERDFDRQRPRRRGRAERSRQHPARAQGRSLPRRAANSAPGCASAT